LRQAIGETISGSSPMAVTSISRRIDASLWRERLLAACCAFFALVALILATIGTYALMATSVAKRRFEIGLRVALGATPASVGARVLREAALVTGVGCAAGLATALFAFRMLNALLFDLTPSDPASMALAAALLLTVALGAAIVPARRAMAVDPLRMLKSD
jgi:ABC-type antimicrobial peptide transport system permease subunit